MNFKLTQLGTALELDTLDIYALDDAAYLTWLAEGNTPEPADPLIIQVPQTVTAFQAFAALDHFGLLDTIESVIKQADRRTQLAFEKAQEFDRRSPTIATTASVLGWSDSQIDNLFIYADKVVA